MWTRSRRPGTESWLVTVALAAVIAGPLSGPLSCSAAPPPPSSLELRSTAFQAGGDIPKKFTCSGPDVSPALEWSEPPSGTRSLALIVDDPDAPAGDWVHWVVFDLPATARRLPEGVAKSEAVPSGGRQGLNDFEKTGYGGPCPPSGTPHRYFFRIYALDKPLGLGPRSTKQSVEEAMKGHILAQGELMGRFGR